MQPLLWSLQNLRNNLMGHRVYYPNENDKSNDLIQSIESLSAKSPRSSTWRTSRAWWRAPRRGRGSATPSSPTSRHATPSSTYAVSNTRSCLVAWLIPDWESMFYSECNRFLPWFRCQKRRKRFNSWLLAIIINPAPQLLLHKHILLRRFLHFPPLRPCRVPEFRTRSISRNAVEASCSKLLFFADTMVTHTHISSHYRFVPDVWHFWMCPASKTLLRFSFLSGQINFISRTVIRKFG